MMAKYFNNDEVQPLIEQYQKTEDVEERRRLAEIIMPEIKKIVVGIIHKHKYTRFEPYDDLLSEGMQQCFYALDRFDPEYITTKGVKATAFSYLSLTAKRSLYFYTKNNQKHREVGDIYYEESGEEVVDDSLIYEERQSSDTIINNLVSGIRTLDLTKNDKQLLELLEKYLHLTGGFNKRDFYRFAKSYGLSQNLIRNFYYKLQHNAQRLIKEV